jgi:hypothetical protein
MKITTVLQYCSNDFRWIEKCVEQASKISEEIIIPVSDHYFDGVPEDREILDKTYKLLSKFPKVQIIEFEWEPGNSMNYWHNMARTIGKEQASNDTDWILFLDTDEIIDDIAWDKWVESKEYEQYDSLKFKNYWYFREPIYQANNWETSVVLVRKEFAYFDLFNPREREQCHEFLNVRKKIGILSIDGLPMIHHYSWVRTKEEMLRKVKSWGHANDRDWVSLVEEEFSRPFNGTDFVPYHHYEYEIVENKYNL